MSSVQNLLALGVLALLGIVAAGIAHWSMSSDIGVTADSMIYLSAADRRVEGKGLTPIGYHFAPDIPSGRANVKRRTLFWCVVLSSFVLFIFNLRPAVNWVSYRHREGEGFTNRAWKDSDTVKFLKALPSQTAVHSNAADACYLFTKREVSRLPAKYDSTSGRDNTDFGAQMEVLRDDLKQQSRAHYLL